MKQVVLKYLLSLYILLLGGFVHSNGEGIKDSSLKNLSRSEQAYTDETGDENRLFFNAPRPSGEKKIDHKINVLLVENEEDDEFSSFKAYLKNCNCATYIFSAQSLDYKEIPPFQKCFSDTPDDRHLLFRVFRI